MVTHLQNCWGTVDHVDITALIAECSNPWSIAEVPMVYFNRVKKAVKQLPWAGVTWDTWAMLNNALKSFKDARDYDAAVCKWDARPLAAQTWENLKTMMCMEYAKTHRQDGVSTRATGHASTHNIMDEYAAATEELIENLTNKHAKQIEALIKSNTETMAKLMKLLKPSPTPAATAGATAGASSQTAQQSEKQQAWIERCKAEKVHPNRKHEQCWELKANAAKRLVNWNSVKVA
jgi:hypothetical protein